MSSKKYFFLWLLSPSIGVVINYCNYHTKQINFYLLLYSITVLSLLITLPQPWNCDKKIQKFTLCRFSRSRRIHTLL